jgi:hypothetical protein
MTMKARLDKLERQHPATPAPWPVRIYKPGEPMSDPGVIVWIHHNGRDAPVGLIGVAQTD